MTDLPRPVPNVPIDYMRVAGAPLLISSVLILGANSVVDVGQGGLAFAFGILGVLTILGTVAALVPFTGLLLSTRYGGFASPPGRFSAWCLRWAYVMTRVLLAVAVVRALAGLALLVHSGT